MARYEDINNAIFDAVSQALYDPIEYMDVVETISEEYSEYMDDDSFAEAVYNGAGDAIRKLFEQWTGK